MPKRSYYIELLMESFHNIKQSLSERTISPRKMHVTPSQSFVLQYAAKHDKSSVKDIAESMFITSSAATQLIDGLVDNGYLVRKDNPDDRRESILVLTEKARSGFSKMKKDRLEKAKEVFGVLSEEELATYLELNHKILDNLKK